MSQSRAFAAVQSKLDQLQKCNNRAERSLTKVGTVSDTSDLHHKIETDRQQALKLCLEVKDLLENCPQNATRSQLAKEFKIELERFEQHSTELKQKDIKLNNASAPGNNSNSTTGTKSNAAARRKKQQSAAQTGYSSLLDDNDDQESLLQQQQQEQLAATLLLSEEQEQQIDIAAMQRRQQEIHQIEEDVQKVATMFQDLQQLVYEQGEQLDVIEENVISTQTNTEQAYVELEQAEEYQIASSNSLKYVLMIGVVALVAVAIVAIVLYTRSKK